MALVELLLLFLLYQKSVLQVLHTHSFLWYSKGESKKEERNENTEKYRGFFCVIFELLSERLFFERAVSKNNSLNPEEITGRDARMSMQSLCADDGIGEMIERYSDMIYRIAAAHMNTREDAEDVYQEVFLIYLQKRQEFREEEHRKAWLIRTTLICCKRALSSSYKKRIF